MKERCVGRSWIYLTGFLALILIGCSPIATPFNLDASPLSSNPSPSPLPTLETLLSTITPQDSKHSQITATAFPSSTTSVLPLATSTLSPLPTLTNDEARQRISELLLSNGNCRLPCLWGMIPGKTSAQEAQTFLVQFSGSDKDYILNDEVGALFWILKTEVLHITLSIGYRSDVNGIVKRLTLHAEAHDVSEGEDKSRRTYDNPDFNQEFQAYMLPQILSGYGPPEKVYILTYSQIPPHQSWGPFYVFLLYPGQGIFIDYEVGLERVGDKVIGCPTHAHMNLSLLAPGNEDYPEVLGGNWDPFFKDPSYYKTLEEAASLTIEEFYQIFKNPENTTCLETPADLWWDPSE